MTALIKRGPKGKIVLHQINAPQIWITSVTLILAIKTRPKYETAQCILAHGKYCIKNSVKRSS